MSEHSKSFAVAAGHRRPVADDVVAHTRRRPLHRSAANVSPRGRLG